MRPDVMLVLLIIGMGGRTRAPDSGRSATPDVVRLWVASGDEYGGTLEDVNAGEVYAPP